MAARAIPERPFPRQTPPARWLVATFVTAILSILSPAVAHGQTTLADPPTATTPWDATVVVGLLSGRPPAPESRGYYDDWFNSAQAGVLMGRHLTPHVKAEVELTTSTEGRRYVERYIQVQGYPYPVPLGSEQFSRVHEIGIALAYQLFDNQWVHPFVQVGAAMDFDRVRSHTWAQSFYAGDSRQPGTQVVAAQETATGATTTITARAVVGGGAKFYVTERMFVRTDARLATGARGQLFAVRVGLGVDF